MEHRDAISGRPYAGETDLEPLIELLRRSTTPDNADEFPGTAEIREFLTVSAPDPRTTTRVWEDRSGRLVAYAMVLPPYNYLLFRIDPVAGNELLESELMRWAVERVHERAREGVDAALHVQSYEHNRSRVALIRRHGFQEQPDTVLRMERSPRTPIPDPQLPAGFALRCVEGEHEVEQYVALHRDAFGTDNMTVEHRLAIMRNPVYRPELDLLVVAPDGTFAAFCVCTIDAEQNTLLGRGEGWIDTIGARTSFKRRGLGRGVLLAGLHHLRKHGADTAVLTTGSWNTSAQSLFHACGFETQANIRRFTRTV